MIEVEVSRGNQIESKHIIKATIINSKNKIIYSTNNDSNFIYPRSAIKIFQAIPFLLSGASNYYKINEKQIALSASSHFGEPNHIKYLKNWLKKANIKEHHLKCGIHNPLDFKSSNNLLLSGKKPTAIFNNCSGKHLAMLTTAKYKKYRLENYTDFNHPIQKSILSILERFTEHKVIKNSFAKDGCNAPQYSFPLQSLALSMQKLSDFEKLQFDISFCLNKLLYCISKNPFFIGGTKRFDSELIYITKGKIFCKGGAEGVLMFADMENKYGGILKVMDGNQRAIPSAAISILKKIGSINKLEGEKLKKWHPEILFNHANKKIGKIECKRL